MKFTVEECIDHAIKCINDREVKSKTLQWLQRAKILLAEQRPQEQPASQPAPQQEPLPVSVAAEAVQAAPVPEEQPVTQSEEQKMAADAS